MGMRRRNGESEEICWSGEGQAFKEKEGDIGATGSMGKENTRHCNYNSNKYH